MFGIIARRMNHGGRKSNRRKDRMKKTFALKIGLLLAVVASFLALGQDKPQGQPPTKGDKVEYHGRFMLSQHVLGYDTNGTAISTAISVFASPRTESSALFYFGFDHKELPSAYKNTSLDKFKGVRGTYEAMLMVTNTVSSSLSLSPEVFQVRMLRSIEPIL